MSRDDARVLRTLVVASLLFCGMAVVFNGVWILVSTPFGRVLPSALVGLTESPLLAMQFMLFVVTCVMAHVLLAAAWCGIWVPIGGLGALPRDRQRSLALLSFMPVLLLVLLVNTRLFPQSIFSFDLEPGAITWAVNIAFWALCTYVAATLVVSLGLWGYALWTYCRPKWARLAMAASAVLAGMLAVLAGLTVPAGGDAPPRQAPDIIVIGIDSLRVDHIGHPGNTVQGLTPALDDLLAGAARVEYAWTPLARTFPAWISILKGVYPSEHGALYNLTRRPMVDDAGSMAHTLGPLGYQRIYAIDETRFSNIDRSFGFDHIIAPAIGASDFLIGTVHDIPLVNLISMTPAGTWMFPSIHMNRALFRVYRPETFDRSLSAGLHDLDPARPMFFVVHFELPHWPYRWATGQHSTARGIPGYPSPPLYQEAVMRVDRQVQSLLDLLEDTGRLDNSLMVLLTDHGEGFRLYEPEWTPFNGEADPSPRRGGHGTSVINPAQNRVLLAFRTYGGTRPVRPGVIGGLTTSLIDIRPTIDEWLGLETPAWVRGVSLLPVLEGRADGRSRRVVGVETGFSPPGADDPDVNAVELAWQNAEFYAVGADGRLFMRDEWVDYHRRRKQRAVVYGDWIVAALPTEDDIGPPDLMVANHRTLQYWDAREDKTLPAGSPYPWMIEEFCRMYAEDPALEVRECDH